MSARPKNEAVLDRLRRLQESRAERELHQKPSQHIDDLQQYALATPKMQTTTNAPSPSTTERVAMLRSHRVDPHAATHNNTRGGGGIASPSSIYYGGNAEDALSHNKVERRPQTARLAPPPSALIKRGPAAVSAPKPQWVGSTNAKSKATPVRNASMPATGRRTPTPRSHSASSTGSNRYTGPSPISSRRPPPIGRGPYPSNKDGYVNTPQPTRLANQGVRRKASGSEAADAYDYEGTLSRGGKGSTDNIDLGNSGSGVNTANRGRPARKAAPLVPITANTSTLVSNSNSATQRQLFGELQQVVVQLSQTAMGDQQQIAHLLRKVEDYEALISDQEKMIEELETLNVKLVAERNSLKAFQGQVHASPPLAIADARTSHQVALRSPKGGYYDDNEHEIAERELGGVGNQRTIIASMIQTIKQEKRQRLLVEEKSSKIIAEQQLAIHRLEQQIKDLAKLDRPTSSRIAVSGRESPTTHDTKLASGAQSQTPNRAVASFAASFTSEPKALQQPPSDDHSEADDLRPIANGTRHHDRGSVNAPQQEDEEGTIAADAKQAFADALAAAGIPSATVPEAFRKPLPELTQLSSDNYHQVPPYSTNTNPPLHTVTSQPYIPRLVINHPQRMSSEAPPYTVAPTFSRATSYSRTHSVVAMSDMGEAGPSLPRSPVPFDNPQEYPPSHASVSMSASRATSSHQGHPSLTVTNLAKNAALGERGISLRNYVYGDVSVPAENADHPLGTPVVTALDRNSPEPYDSTSVLHTARSVASQASQRSGFLRSTNTNGASLGPDSPPRGTIGTAAAMDKILDDIKRRHNL